MRSPDDLADTPLWFRSLLAVALLSGAGSGVVGLTQTDDRYRGSDAKADLALRDTRIRGLEVELHQHLEHSATYTQVIVQLRHDLEEMERDMREHMRGHQ